MTSNQHIQVDIGIRNNQEQFFPGDLVAGSVEIVLPDEIPLSAIALSFNCIGEVQWVEHPANPHYRDGHVYHDQHVYHKEVAQIAESDVTVVPYDEERKRFDIPFSFEIPAESLPSTTVGEHGYVKYFIRISLDQANANFAREITVYSPMKRNLMVTVSGGADKVVYMNGGKVLLFASADRKGWAPGETITVHCVVDNRTSSSLIPRISLRQIQIFMSGTRHKTIESTLTEEPVQGSEIPPHTKLEELLEMDIPYDLLLSIKSSVITVKYFIHLTLDIPLAFDLHVNLPIILTSKQVIDQQLATRMPSHIQTCHNHPQILNQPKKPQKGAPIEEEITDTVVMDPCFIGEDLLEDLDKYENLKQQEEEDNYLG